MAFVSRHAMLTFGLVVAFGTLGASAAPPRSLESRQPFTGERFTTPDGQTIYGGSLGSTMCCNYRVANGRLRLDQCPVQHRDGDLYVHFKPVQPLPPVHTATRTVFADSQAPRWPARCVRPRKSTGLLWPAYSGRVEEPKYIVGPIPRWQYPRRAPPGESPPSAAEEVLSDDPPPTCPPIENCVAQGEERFAQRRYGEARMLFRRALQFDPGDAYARVMAGLCEFALGDYYHAARSVRAGLEAEPCLIDEPPDLVRLYGPRGNLSLHLATLERYAAKHPDDPEVRLLVGYVTYAAGQREYAALACAHTLQLSARDALALQLLVASRSLSNAEPQFADARPVP